MTKLYLILSFIFISISIQAQWSELGGDSSLKANNYASVCAIDSKGNVYTGGFFTNEFGKYYLAKFDGKQWVEVGKNSNLKFNSPIYSIYIDKKDNIYIGGSFSDSISTDQYVGNCKYYVAKFNGKEWSLLDYDCSINKILFSRKWSYVKSLNGDSKGNIYAVIDDNEIYNNEAPVLKFDGVKWQYLLDSNLRSKFYNFKDVKCDKFDNIYINCMRTKYQDNPVILKSGNGSSWENLVGFDTLTSEISFNCFDIDTFNNIYIGSFSLNTYENYLIKHDGKKWIELKKFKKKRPWAIKVDFNQNIYTLLYSGGGYSKLNFAYFEGKNWIETEILRQKNNSAHSTLSSICSDNKGNVFVATEFDPYYNKYYVLKYNSLGLSSISNQKRESFSIAPNPCSNCELITSKHIDAKDYSVIDVLGKQVNATFDKSSNGYRIILPEESQGIYFLQNNQSGEVMRFMKE